MKTTMVARRRVCSPREGAPPPPIAPGGGCRDRSSFSPRSSVPQDRLQDARREDARPAERLRGERPEPGGGCAAAGGDSPAAPSALPVLGGGEQGPSSGLPLPPALPPLLHEACGDAPCLAWG